MDPDAFNQACKGKSQSQGGLNLPEFKRDAIHLYPDHKATIKTMSRKQLEAFCKQQRSPIRAPIRAPIRSPIRAPIRSPIRERNERRRILIQNEVAVVTEDIESLEEIVDEIPEGIIELRCNGHRCRSLRGIERLPSITKLFIPNNRITSLDGLAGSHVTNLIIYNNQITSLKGLIGSPVTRLVLYNNRILSLEGLAGSTVTDLYINHNRVSSLKGLAGSQVTTLRMIDNKVTSLEGLADSQITTLYIQDNQVSSLEGLAYSRVIEIHLEGNPCYDQFIDEFDGSVQKVKEHYELDEVKDPGYG